MGEQAFGINNFHIILKNNVKFQTKQHHDCRG